MKEILRKLKEQIDSLDVDELNENIYLLEETAYMEDKNLIMDVLFLILETNSDEDFGSPGPIVHFLEKFYKMGYEEKLIDSINKKPTSHTVWMLSRILNDSENKISKIYPNIMIDLLDRKDIGDDLKAEISDFLN